jgi:DNA-binding transcriptional regulator of glucitol operon
VRRVLLSPKWLFGHVLVLALAVACCRLGWWQWDRYQQTRGALQNLGYAVQWPVFAVFGVALWARIVRDSVRPPEAAGRAARRVPPRPVPPPVRPGGRGPAGPERVELDAGEEAELAAYNQYLSSLYERDRQERR